MPRAVPAALLLVALVLTGAGQSTHGARAGPPDGLVDALASDDPIARLRSLSTRQLGFEPGAAPPSVPLPLVSAANELMLRMGAVDPEAIGALAGLDAAAQAGLAPVFNAFLAYDAATRAYLAGASAEALPSARLQLLEATLAFGRSASSYAPLNLDAAPAFTLDLVGVDSTYAADAALAIDVGGNDVYLNRAGGGGSFVSLLCPILAFQPRMAGRTLPAGYLADYAGDDQYVSGYDCGANGGGFQGSGFLYDESGNDRYLAGQGGVNGGAFHAGFGYLLDVAGDDAYEARPQHTTYGYGANGAGSMGGFGLLDDGGGRDAYVAGQEGANGGGYALGVGALVDAWGDDSYRAGALGTNGAGYNGDGLLWDGGGDDRYVATQEWGFSNGEGHYDACLYDADGHDWYDDNQGNAGWDLTVHPKGPSGSQFDDVGGALGECPAAA